MRSQFTEIRQRHQLPFYFDKRMARLPIGEGDLLAVLQISSDEQPEDLDSAFSAWRQRALAAAGLLASVLDERVAGEELFEDLLLLRNGEFVGAADRRSRVRGFLPFEVNTGDRAALDQLAGLSLDEASDIARAARLYRRAANEGPTADAFAMLWVAAECFSEQRTLSRKEIEAALEDSGLNPAGLPISVGRLIGLRAKVQHHGVEDDDQLRDAYYEMEAIVRCLIRQRAQLVGGWWPAADDPASFAEPFDAAVAQFSRGGESDWHEDALPPVAEPEALYIPRQVANADRDARLSLDPRLGDAVGLMANTVIDALEWVNPNASLAVSCERPRGAPAESLSGANAEEIWLAPQRLEGWDDQDTPHVLVNLVWDLYALAGYAFAQQAGLTSEGTGVAVVEGLGAWLQYTRLVTHGDLDPVALELQLPTGDDPVSIGKLAGWAAAGDEGAAAAVADLTGSAGEMGRSLMEALRDAPPSSALGLLD